MRTNPQYVVLFHHFRRYLEAAIAEGIDVAPLKGAHLLTSVYPKDRGRGPIADVDFLVRGEQWERALSIAEEIGWRRRPSPVDEALGHEVGFHCDSGGALPLLFEAHRALFEPSRFPLDCAAIFARAERGVFEGVLCTRLSSEDHFAHLALHEVVHRLTTLERTLCDLDLLIDAGGVSSARLFPLAREWGITRIVWLMLELLSERSPDLEPIRHRAALAPKVAIRLTARTAARLVASGDFARNHYRLAAALLWPWLFDSKARLARFVIHHPSAAGASRPRRSRSGTS